MKVDSKFMKKNVFLFFLNIYLVYSFASKSLHIDKIMQAEYPVINSCIHGYTLENRENRRMEWRFLEHSSGHPFEHGAFSRGTQLRRHYTVPCGRYLYTAEAGGTGLSYDGTHRDTLYRI